MHILHNWNENYFFILLKNLPRFLCNHVYIFFSLKSFATRWSFILLENLWNILLVPWFVSLEVRPSCLYKELSLRRVQFPFDIFKLWWNSVLMGRKMAKNTVNKCMFIQRSVWITKDNVIMIKIRSCKLCLACLGEIDTTSSSSSSESEWNLGSHGRQWQSLKDSKLRKLSLF